MFPTRIATRRLGIIFCVLVLVALVQGREATGGTVLKLAHPHPPTEDIIGPSATLFCDLVQKYTNGNVEVQHFHSGQLGSDERELAESVRVGTLDMSIVATAPMTGFLPRLTLIDLPFLFKDHAHAIRVLEGPIGDTLKQELEARGIVLLEFWSAGIRSVLNNIKPVRTPDDLKGLKLRVIQSPVYLDTFKALGALPVAMSPSEVYSALQMGVVNGAENDPASLMSWKWAEVIKYYSLTQHAFVSTALIINPKVYRSLPADIQQAIQKAGREASAYQRTYVEGLWDRAMKRIEEKGVRINKVDDINAFRERVKPVYEKYDKELGGNLIKQALDAGALSK
jgi:tripartite ATP-independent transporter DctP family solute receptor